jgi:hypothetical protein
MAWKGGKRAISLHWWQPGVKSLRWKMRHLGEYVDGRLVYPSGAAASLTLKALCLSM